jgi:hypothetical protein
MEVQVVNAKDGTHELITLTAPVTIETGKKSNRLISGNIEHWFDRDGRYEGWSANLGTTKMNTQKATT